MQSMSASSLPHFERTANSYLDREKIQITGDVSQLIIPQEQSITHYGLNKTKVASVLPTYRQGLLELPEKKSVSKNEIDMFNLNMGDDYGAGGKLASRPIERAGKATTRQFQKSLGPLKKMPRERGNMAKLKKALLKLAPPPLGRSLGHGIISPQYNINPI